MSFVVDTKKRSYDMRSRGEAASATRAAIVAAVIDCVAEQCSLAITLASVAEHAGVTVKTIHRHFGSREALLDAAWATAYDDVLAERTTPPDDVDTALRALVEHYEKRGPMMLGLLAEERDDVRARQICDSGRAVHRRWVRDVFGGQLPPDRRAEYLDALLVATDLYSWKLLRLDCGHSKATVRDRMALTIEALLTAAKETS